MVKPALHVISLPHTSCTWAWSWCAYTMKALKLARMMDKIGYDVTLYASDESIFPNTVPCVYGPATAEVTEPKWNLDYFELMNRKVIKELKNRAGPQDIICLTTGNPQAPIADSFPDNLICEYGIGYSGILNRSHHVFESYAWMHSIYGFRTGQQPPKEIMSAPGVFYDQVIPNYFEVDQFPKGTGEGDYLLYVGRMIPMKGLDIAVETAKRSGLPLVLAGQGTPPEYGEYVGVVGPDERSRLMGNARAILVPSLYLEPFGGVSAEAQICGTPVISTDWGAFPENVEQGKTGYRCHTIAEFAKAVEDVKSLDREYIRERAISKWSTEVISLQYDTYFERLQGLYGDGFYG
jgi:glycosyltransferase involved in cell wall biosynthesis